MELKTYPIYKRGGVQKAYKKLPPKEKTTIGDFIRYVSITSTSQKRYENIRRILTQLRIITRKDFSKINLEDLRQYLGLLNSSSLTNSSRNDCKATIKRFLRWKFKDWSQRFDNLSDIRLVMRMNEERINSNTLLKKEDVDAIMEAEPKLYWKTFFITLYESGLRPNELRNLKWQNIKFDVNKDGITEISIFATKTHRARSVYVKGATFYLKKLKKQAKNDLVFPAPRNPNKTLGKSMASVWLNRISKKVLGREVFPYLLRHSRATELYTNAGIPDKIAQKFLGHSKSMGDVYTHLSSKDVQEAVGKSIYQFEELPPEKRHKLELEVEELKARLKQIEDSFKTLAGGDIKQLLKFLETPTIKN